jgi:Raf kinase inhibitor-like YbhB/YbcL family protein
MHFKILSPAFGYHQMMPIRYTCDGDDVSPELAWEDVPESSVSFALILRDTSDPTDLGTHWVAFNIPAETRHLPEGIPETDTLPVGGLHGRNDFGVIGYTGPCPPKGDPTHHYHFSLFALDTQLNLGPGAYRLQLLAAMENHVKGQAQLIGLYKRRS